MLLIMQSRATSVDEYLKEVPEERREALIRIRQICLHSLSGYKESMRYGNPCYEKNDIAEVSFASQKNNIALYILKTDVMEANKHLLSGLSTGKGCIRYTKPEKINFEVIEKMIKESYLSIQKIC